MMDLNLLRVFDALMQSGSVTGAADRLHLTPPAVSRALGRLRSTLGDEIMVRSGRGLAPTPFAIDSAEEIRRILGAVDQLIGGGTEHDPRRWHRTVRIRVNDALIPTVAPALLTHSRTDAPGVSLLFIPEGSTSVEDLRDGAVDIDVGVGEYEATDIRSENIAQDLFVAAVARDRPLGNIPRLSLDDLCNSPHVVASRWARSWGPIDDALAAVGRRRQVAAVVPSLIAAAMLALESDVVTLIPRLLARYLQQRGLPLTWHDLPIQVPAVDIVQHWHRRLDDDQPTLWLRQLIRTAIAAQINQHDITTGCSILSGNDRQPVRAGTDQVGADDP